MSAEQSALTTLSTNLCPWLAGYLQQLDAARSAQRLGHAWLLAGPRGIGKINLALVWARRLLQGDAGPTTVPTLPPTDFIAAMRERHAPADHHPDLHWLFPEEDKRTISIDQIRGVTEALALKAYRGAAKVVIVEPAEDMTIAAANALLKTLEQPAGDAYLLLVSHQPERLPATIRSRCQRLSIARPATAAVAEWLGRTGADVAALWLATGGSPLQIAESIDHAKSSLNNTLEDKLLQIHDGKIDALAVADEWFKLDCELVLSWLVRRIHGAVRARLVPNGSTAVTDRGADTLHNAWATLTLRTLFEQHQAAERLLNQLGAGVNVELALRALLLGFQPDRGRM